METSQDTDNNEAKVVKEHMPNEEILSHCVALLNEIQNNENKKLSVDKLKEKMEKNFKKLNDTYPSLFSMILEQKGTFEINKLIHMLGLTKKINKGELTQHGASVVIGQKYYDEYVKPKINEK